MFEHTYHKMNEKILPDPALDQAVLEKAVPRHTIRLRPAALLAVVLVIVIMVTPVLAVQIPAVQDLMHFVSPEMASRFTPIQESCKKNGVRMEVISASLHGRVIELYVTLEGDAITENTLINDYSIQGIVDYASGIENLGYDEESGKLTCLITMQNTAEDTAKAIEGSKVTVKLNQLTNYLPNVDVEAPLTLTDREVLTVSNSRNLSNPSEADCPFESFSYGAAEGDPFLNQTEFDLLAPGERIYSICDGLNLTGVQFIDGRLHIQTMVEAEHLKTAYYYELYLQDAAGNTVHPTNHLGFQETDYSDEYEEAIFDISEEALGNYTLHILTTPVELIDGPWRLTFALKESGYTDPLDDIIPTTSPAWATEETAYIEGIS